MISIPHCIHALEGYILHSGAHLLRTALPDCVHGRVYCDLITLRTGLSPQQELVTLVHELAHWLVHRDARCTMDCTLFEYEAEAVEALVMARLDLPHAGFDPDAPHLTSPTDNLLSASVARVIWASAQVCSALGIGAEALVSDALVSDAQAPVDIEAATGKEIVFEYEQYGMGDFLRLPEAL